jgi:hypothetical protein
MRKSNLLLIVFGVFASVLFFACEKDNDTSAMNVDELVNESLYSVQERGGIGSNGCYELVFPVSMKLPDGTSATFNSYDEMKASLKSFHQRRPKGHGGNRPPRDSGSRPEFVFPFSVISQDGTTQVINNQDELHTLREACGGGSFGNHGPKGHGGRLKCFELNFPISLTLPDGTTKSFADHKSLGTFLKDWRTANPNAPERPKLSFPLTVTMKSDSTTVTLNSKEELKSLKENCRK